MAGQFRATNSFPYRLAKGLGWFSIGRGLAELAAPGKLSRVLGAHPSFALVQGFGLREIAQGAGILTQRDPTPWVWARVAGDALDIAALLPALGSRNPRRGSAIFSTLAIAGVAALDYLCARELEAMKRRSQPVRDYSDRVGLGRPPHEMRGIAAEKMRGAALGEGVSGAAAGR